MKKIVIVGSINHDYTLKVDHLPSRGETLLASGNFRSVGGKGANQAAALAKLGTEVSIIGAVGNDDNGKLALNNLKNYGVNVNDVIIKKDYPTGSAYICIDKNAHNTIVVNLGANGALNIQDIEKHKSSLLSADYCLMQLEIPLDVVAYVTKLCHENKIPVLLNPAPANSQLSDAILQGADYLLPNETELELLTGKKVTQENVIEVGRILIQKGVKALVVTMGEYGAYYIDCNRAFHVPVNKVVAVDTTAAGDSFIGAFLAGIAEDKSLEDSLKLGSLVASITVCRVGAVDSIPRLDELN
jgi:ribokinase